MTERQNPPVVIAAQAVAVLTEKRSSLVGRGLEALKTKPVRHNIVPKEDVDLLHELTIMFDAAFSLGHRTLKDATKYIKEHLKEFAGVTDARLEDMFKDALPEDMFKMAYATSIKQNCGELGWYRRAADQGDAEAQYFLGDMYYTGEGVPQNYEEAVKWYRLAADQGNPAAQNNLGQIYRDGYGCPDEDGVDEDDYEPSEAWLLAYEQSQIKAFDLFMLAAKQGHLAAQENLGYMYQDGAGVTLDQTKAAEWYQLAASQGSSVAQFELFKMYIDGLGVQQDYEKASYRCKKAAEQGLPAAQVKLGELYEKGTGIEQNVERAKYWYREAANHLRGNSYTSDEIVIMLFLEPSKASICNSGMQAIKALERLSER